MKGITRKQTHVLLHLIFWVGYIIIQVYVLGIWIGMKFAWIRVFGSLVFHLPLVYIHLFYLMPRYLEKKKWAPYLLGTLMLIVVLSFGRNVLDIYYLELMMDGYHSWWIPKIDPKTQQFLETNNLITNQEYRPGFYIAGLMMLLMTAPLRMWQIWYDRIQFQQKQLEAELKFLRTQINPHFLFNALNNIYTLSYTGSEKAANMILKLSGLMRYMLYDSNVEKVPLVNEIGYIRNYLELQQLKTEYPQQIVFEVIGDPNRIKIPPMLFIPLFENAIKHGNVEQSQRGWIHSILEISGVHLRLEVRNSYEDSRRKDKTGGIGLENMKQRLTLLYPEAHYFTTQKNPEEFIVNLSLTL